MADIDWDDVVAVAPSLATGVSADLQTMILAHVNVKIAAAEFGGNDSPTFKLARAYYAAHMGAVAIGGITGAAGPVTSKSEGGVSISYGSPSGGAEGAFGETPYGRMFMMLVRQSPGRAGFIT